MSKAQIFPNPSSGKITFRSGTPTLYAKATFVVFDISGREVKRLENLGAFEFEIDMSSFGSGLYFYKYVGNDAEVASGKFVVQD